MTTLLDLNLATVGIRFVDFDLVDWIPFSVSCTTPKESLRQELIKEHNFDLAEAGIEPGAQGDNLPLKHLSYTILYYVQPFVLAKVT